MDRNTSLRSMSWVDTQTQEANSGDNIDDFLFENLAAVPWVSSVKEE